MFILIIPSWYPTKSNPLNGIFFKEQAQALKKSGHKVVVAYTQLISLRKVFEERDYKGIIVNNEDGIETYRYSGYNYIPKNYFFRKYLYKKRLYKLYKLIEKEHGKPDIIHAHSILYGGYSASLLGNKEKIPTVLTEHSTAYARNILNKKQKEIIIETLSKIDKKIVVGPGLKRDLSMYNEGKDDIDTIPNLINTDNFVIDKSIIKNDRFRFLSISFLTHKKGIDVLIKSFGKLKEKNTELVIGGDGPERHILKKLAKDLGISDRVIFLGELNRNEVKKEMQKCDIFVLPSRYETFGVVFIEALASGKPIIATECGGPEIIVNKKNGYLVPVEDIDALAEAMKKSIDEHNKFNPYEIREDCINRFSEKAVVRRLEEAYKEVLKDRKKENICQTK